MSESQTRTHKDISTHKSPWAHYSVGCAGWDEFETKLPPPVSPRPDVQTMREQSAYYAKLRKEKMRENGVFIERGLSVKNGVMVPVHEPEGEIEMRVYIPDGEGPFPVLCWMHGGGYVLGNLDNADSTCRIICVENKVAVFNIDYRLAPEFQFPIGIMDSFEAIKWVAKHATEYKGDVKKGFIVGGTSAGGNFTAGVCILARDDPSMEATPLTGQILQIPSTCAPGAVPDELKERMQSREDLWDAPLLDKAAVQQFSELYVPQTWTDLADTRLSPLLVTHDRSKPLPPAFFQISGKDPLRDEGLLFAEELESKGGVKTRVEVYKGTPHGFGSLVPGIPESLKWRTDLKEGLDWLIAGAP